MGMTVTLDRMIHTNAVHHELGKEIGLEGCCAFGGKGEDPKPLSRPLEGSPGSAFRNPASLARGRQPRLSVTVVAL